MESRFKPIALTLMIFSCLGIVTGAWAECILSIVPDQVAFPPGSEVSICPQLTCDYCVPPAYTWEISESTCTVEGVIIAAGDCISYTPPGGCSETIKVTDTANGCSAETTVKVCGEIAVSISPTTTDLGNGETQTFTAKTTCDGAEISGCYSWELDGQEVGIGTTYTFICIEGNEGSKTLTVTDSCNGGETATAQIICPNCEINVIQDQVARSRWIPLPAPITIECRGPACDFNLLCRIYISCKSKWPIIPMGRLVIPNADPQTIQLLVLIPPSYRFDTVCEACTIELIGCGCDSPYTFVNVCPLPFPLDLQR